MRARIMNNDSWVRVIDVALGKSHRFKNLISWIKTTLTSIMTPFIWFHWTPGTHTLVFVRLRFAIAALMHKTSCHGVCVMFCFNNPKHLPARISIFTTHCQNTLDIILDEACLSCVWSGRRIVKLDLEDTGESQWTIPLTSDFAALMQLASYQV